jgi:hypothetical protein
MAPYGHHPAGGAGEYAPRGPTTIAQGAGETARTCQVVSARRIDRASIHGHGEETSLRRHGLRRARREVEFDPARTGDTHLRATGQQGRELRAARWEEHKRVVAVGLTTNARSQATRSRSHTLAETLARPRRGDVRWRWWWWWWWWWWWGGWWWWRCFVGDVRQVRRGNRVTPHPTVELRDVRRSHVHVGQCRSVRGDGTILWRVDAAPRTTTRRTCRERCQHDERDASKGNHGGSDRMPKRGSGKTMAAQFPILYDCLGSPVCHGSSWCTRTRPAGGWCWSTTRTLACSTV